MLSQLKGEILLLDIELFPVLGAEATYSSSGETQKLLLRMRWRLSVLDFIVPRAIRIAQLMLVVGEHADFDTGLRRALHPDQVTVRLQLAELLRSSADTPIENRPLAKYFL